MSKASGGDGIPVELFQILKDDAVKVLHSICQQMCKTQQCPQDWKRSVFIPIPKKGSTKECSNTRTVVLNSHTSKVMLKILQTRVQQYMNSELPDVQAGFRKAEVPEIKLLTSVASSKKQEIPRIASAWLTNPSLWLCVSQQIVEKFSRDGNTRSPYLPPEKSVCRSRSKSYNWTWNNRLVPNQEGSISRLYNVTLLI